jgi:hypothetical protein
MLPPGQFKFRSCQSQKDSGTNGTFSMWQKYGLIRITRVRPLARWFLIAMLKITSRMWNRQLLVRDILSQALNPLLIKCYKPDCSHIPIHTDTDLVPTMNKYPWTAHTAPVSLMVNVMDQCELMAIKDANRITNLTPLPHFQCGQTPSQASSVW